MEAQIHWLERVVVTLMRALANWTEEEIKLLATRQGDVRDFLKGATTPQGERGMDTETQLIRWKNLYRELFGMELDVTNIRVPERKPGFDRLIVVVPGLTYARLVEVTRPRFTVNLYTENLDSEVIDCRTAEGEPYAIWVRDRKEADEENRNLPASHFPQADCETLRERWLHELCHHVETGTHLDEKNWTLCAGSRYRSGVVPCVFWAPVNREFYVCWCDAGYRVSYSAARSVVR